MFYKNIDVFLKSCRDELCHNDNQNIQKNLELIEEYVPKDTFNDFIEELLRYNLSQILVCKLEESEVDTIFEQIIADVVKKLKSSKKSIKILVELEELGNEINRTMEIPYNITVADLAYFVLGTLRAQASHLFSVYYKKERFVCNADSNDFGEPETYAEDVDLSSLNLRKNSKLKVWYDYGDDYTLTIKVLEIIDHDQVFQIDDSFIHNGKGYGIWEDNHNLLDLYYENREAFSNFIEEEGLEEDYFPVEEEFDLDEYNESLFEDYETMKRAYEDIYDEEDDF